MSHDAATKEYVQKSALAIKDEILQSALNKIQSGLGKATALSYHSIIKFLGNLFKFKAETIFNRRNIQYILRIKNFFQRRSWAN